jgi:hypothetical protein
MPRGVKKENLPTKVCVTCGRSFNWRKKWERVWDEVTTCSKSCNRKRRVVKQQKAANKTSEESNELLDSSCSHGEENASDFAGDDQLVNRVSWKERNNAVEENENICVEDEVEDLIGKFENDILNPSAALPDMQNNVAVDDTSSGEEPEALRNAKRKAAKKAQKAERRAQREGRGDPDAGRKQCDMCGRSVDLLIRCMYEEGKMDWKMVCGKCWKVASGGVVDGDANHPHYRYGGLWKNRRAQT